MAMQRFFEFFRRKNYGALWNNLFNFFHLAKHIKKITASFGVDYFLLLPLFKFWVVFDKSRVGNYARVERRISLLKVDI